MSGALAEWLVTLNASGALDSLAAFAEQAKKELADLDEQGKGINPGQGIADGASAALDPVRRLDAALTGLESKASKAGGALAGDLSDIIDQLAKIPDLRKQGFSKATLGQMEPGFVRSLADQLGLKAPSLPPPGIKGGVPAPGAAGLFQPPPAPPSQPPPATPSPTPPSQSSTALTPIQRIIEERPNSRQDTTAPTNVTNLYIRNVERAIINVARGDINLDGQREPQRAPRVDTPRQHRGHEIDLTRALAVAGYMRAAGPARELTSLGFSDTGEKRQADFYRLQLGRQFASVWAPVVSENAAREARLTGWMQSLSGNQQEAIRGIVQFTRFAAPMMAAPHIANSLARLTGTSSIISPGIGRMLGPIGLLSGLAMSTPQGRESLAEIVRAFEPAAKTLLLAVQQMQPVIAKFTEGVANAVVPLISALATNIQPGGLIGAGAGYLFGGWRGALIGGAAGQLGDMVGGPNFTARHPYAIGLGGVGFQVAGPGGALAGTAGGMAVDELVRPEQLYRRWFGGLMTRVNPGDAAGLQAAGETLYQHSGVLGQYRPFTGQFDASGVPRSDLSGAPRGFEEIAQTWSRLTEAATQISLMEQSLQVQQDILAELKAAAKNSADNPIGAAAATVLTEILGEL